MSTKRLSISPAFMFTKGQRQRGNSNVTERKNKAVNVGDVNYDVNTDWGTMMFTSSVSLLKDSKQLCWVNKLQLGNSQNYKCTAMLIILPKSKRLNRIGITPIEVDFLFINIYSLIIHLEMFIQNMSLVMLQT